MSRPPSQSTLTELLKNQRNPLSQLVRKAEALEQLQRHVIRCLPQEMQNHVQVAAFRDNSLILITDAGAWATRLRHLQQEIIRRLNHEVLRGELKSLSIKVRPSKALMRNQRQANRLSKENAQLLLEEAEQTKDEGLKRVLRSIARNTRDAG